MKAIRRNLRISSKKVNLVANLVRGKTVEDAINFLNFTPKRSARPLMEAIRSAAANAEQNFKQQRSTLMVSKIIVNEGATFKRFRPVSRGRSHPILKRTTHITVEVAVKGNEEKGKRGKGVAELKSIESKSTKKLSTSSKSPKSTK